MNHLFTAGLQPATRFVDRTCDKPIFVVTKPFALRRCWKCRKLHRAENMVVQVFYDSVRYWCRDGKGCKR